MKLLDWLETIETIALFGVACLAAWGVNLAVDALIYLVGQA